MSDKQLRTFSYGGGVQSTAALVFAAEGKIDYRIFLFANVGEDSEHPKTLAYVRDVAIPYATEHGIELHEIRRITKKGNQETVLERLLGDNKSVPIPVRGANGGPAFRRNCTVDFKIKVILKWLKQHGASADNPAITGLGISIDEIQRMRIGSEPQQQLEYPLIDLHLTRAQCVEIIRKSGLPLPGKSSCYFCPYHTPTEWGRMKREEPDLFEKSVALERELNTKLKRIGHKKPVWLTRFAKPLDQAIGDQTAFDFSDEWDNCESGYCMV